jgi:peptidyl-prolyl cis-trans isomerase SurA
MMALRPTPRPRPAAWLLIAASLVVAVGTAAAQPDPLPPPEPGDAVPVKRDQRTPRSTAAGQTVTLDRVVAVVNDAIVLESELVMRLLPLTADLDAIEDPRERSRREEKLATQMLEEMISEELMVSAAEEAKIEVEPGEIQAAYDDVKQQNKLDDAGMAKALSLQGLTINSYKADLRRQLLRMRAVNLLVRPRVTVTDEDVRARYDAMSRRSEAVSSVFLHHVLITVPDKATEQEKAQARARATEVIEKAKAGEDFAKLAAAYSDDAGTSKSGGELGWIQRGSIPTEWEAVVFSMEKGEVRGPITGPSGLHVFYVADVKQSDLKSFDDMKEQLRNELFRREMDKQTGLWLDELRKKAYIQVKL